MLRCSSGTGVGAWWFSTGRWAPWPTSNRPGANGAECGTRPSSLIPARRWRPTGVTGSGLALLPCDPGLRFLVALESTTGAEELLSGGAARAISLRPFAGTRGLAPALGAELVPCGAGGYGGGVFLPFRDATAGAATFGCDRYLIDTLEGRARGARPTAAWCSMSTSPTTDPAPTRFAGRARWRHRPITFRASVRAGERAPDT